MCYSKKLPIFSALAIALVLSAVGCGAGLSVSIPGKGGGELNFRYRSDSARPGDFRGPFTGTIRDKSSKFPVSNAEVTAFYYFTLKGRPFRTITKQVRTDNNGRYFIPKLSSYPFYRPGLVLEKTDLFMWRNNYLPYTASRDGGVVTQFDHLVLLKRDSGPVKNPRVALSYSGIGDYSEKASEVYYKAAGELGGQRAVKLDSGALLLPEQVQKVLNRKMPPEVGELRSKVEESGYILTFRDGTIVSWNVWSALQKQAQNRMTHYSSQLQGVRAVDLFGSRIDARMGISDAMRIMMIHFKGEGLVLAVGCTAKRCDESLLMKLSRLAVKRRGLLIFMEDWTHE